MEANRRRSLILSIVIVLLCVGGSAAASRLQREREDISFASLAAVPVREAEAAYLTSGDTEDLIYLLKVLCCQAELTGDASAGEKIAQYGTELLALAKAEAIDLEELGEADETLLTLLSLIRGYGAA